MQSSTDFNNNEESKVTSLNNSDSNSIINSIIKDNSRIYNSSEGMDGNSLQEQNRIENKKTETSSSVENESNKTKNVITVTATSSFISRSGVQSFKATPNFHNPLNNLFKKSAPTLTSTTNTSYNSSFNIPWKQNNNQNKIFDPQNFLSNKQTTNNVNRSENTVQNNLQSGKNLTNSISNVLSSKHDQIDLHEIVHSNPKSPTDDILLGFTTPFTPLSPVADSIKSNRLFTGNKDSMIEDGNLFPLISGRKDNLTQKDSQFKSYQNYTQLGQNSNAPINFSQSNDQRENSIRIKEIQFDEEDFSHPIYNSQGISFKYTKDFMLELPLLKSYYPYNNQLNLENFCKKRQITLNDPSIVDSSHCYVVIRFRQIDISFNTTQSNNDKFLAKRNDQEKKNQNNQDFEFQIQRDNGDWIKLKRIYKITEEDKKLWSLRKNDLLKEEGLELQVKSGNRIYLPATEGIENERQLNYPFYKFILTKFARKYNIDLTKSIRIRYRDGLIQIINRRNHWVTRGTINHVDYITRMRNLWSGEGFNEELKRKGNHLYIILPEDALANQKSPIQLNLNAFSRKHDIDVDSNYIRLRIRDYNIIEIKSREGTWELFYDFESGSQEITFDAYGENLITAPQKKGAKLAVSKRISIAQPPSIPKLIDPQLVEATNLMAIEIIRQLMSSRGNFFPQMIQHTPIGGNYITPMTPAIIPAMTPTGLGMSQNIPVTPVGLGSNMLHSGMIHNAPVTPVGLLQSNNIFPQHMHGNQAFHHEEHFHSEYDMAAFPNEFESSEWTNWEMEGGQHAHSLKRKYDNSQLRTNPPKKSREDEDFFEFPMEMDLP